MRFLRAEGNYDVDAASEAAAVGEFEPTLTQQHEKDEADINEIVRRFGVTGELPYVTAPPTFGDFTEAVDYHTAMNVIARANAAFAELPADVRYEFHNDPGLFVAFCEDKKNLPRLRELGLAIPEVVGDNNVVVPVANENNPTE